MSFIKKNLKVCMMLIITIFIASILYYVSTILPSQMETLELLNNENEDRKKELGFLEEELQGLPKTKIELSNMVMETKALKNKIPHHQMSISMMMEIVKHIDAYDFQDTQVLTGDLIAEEKGKNIYHTIPMTIKFTALVSSAVQLLEGISRSDYMVTVDHFAIDNSIQEENNKDEDSIVSGDMVKVEMLLSLNYMAGDSKEIQPNSMGYSSGNHNVFLRPGNEGAEGLEESSQQTSGIEATKEPRDTTTFEIYLADIFRSGNNYAFSGYSPGKDPVYVGITSEKDTTITLSVRDNGYTCLIEDSEGKGNEQTISVNVKDPSININSKTQKIMEKMPTVKIKIKNYTSEVIEVNMRGSLLENISIYNENNQIVPQGKQVGKIALNI